MATFKPFKHHTVELKKVNKMYVSVSISIKRHTGKEDTYGTTIEAKGRSVVKDQHNLYWDARDILEEKGFCFSEVYY